MQIPRRACTLVAQTESDKKKFSLSKRFIFFVTEIALAHTKKKQIEKGPAGPTPFY